MTSSTWPTAFEDAVRAHLPQCPPERSIEPDTFLADLGLDSLTTVSLLIALEDEYGVTFPDELLAADTFATAASLWAGVQRAAAHGGAELPE